MKGPAIFLAQFVGEAQGRGSHPAQDLVKAIAPKIWQEMGTPVPDNNIGDIAKLVHMAAGFTSDVTIVKDGTEVDAKSILGLLLVGAPLGAMVHLTCEGPDEADALAALRALIASKFEEET